MIPYLFAAFFSVLSNCLCVFFVQKGLIVLEGDQIIERGKFGDTLYIIKDGMVSCRIGIKEVRKLGNNDYFGQNAILIDVKRGLDIFSIQKTLCYELSRNDLKDALGKDYVDVILFCFFKSCVEKSDYLKIILHQYNLYLKLLLNHFLIIHNIKFFE